MCRCVVFPPFFDYYFTVDYCNFQSDLPLTEMRESSIAAESCVVTQSWWFLHKGPTHTHTPTHPNMYLYMQTHTHTHTLWESDTVEHSNLIGQPASSGQLISFCLVSSIRVHLFSLLKQFDSNVIAAGYEHSNRFRSVVGIVHLPLSANWMNNTWMMLRHIVSNRLQCLLLKYVAANQNCRQLPWRFKISGRCKRLTNQSHSTLIIDSND